MKKLLFLIAVMLLPLVGSAQTFPIAKIMKVVESYETRQQLVANMKSFGYTQAYHQGDQWEEEAQYVFVKGCTSNKSGKFVKITNRSTASIVIINKYMDGGYYAVKFLNSKYLPTARSYAKSHEATVKKNGSGWIYEYSWGY